MNTTTLSCAGNCALHYCVAGLACCHCHSHDQDGDWKPTTPHIICRVQCRTHQAVSSLSSPKNTLLLLLLLFQTPTSRESDC
jgi:hypothetical protein